MCIRNIQCPDGSTYRRNRKHIIKTEEEQSKPFEIEEDYEVQVDQSNDEKKSLETRHRDDNAEVTANETSKVVVTNNKLVNVHSPVTTRSGRMVKKPIRFKDYQL
jgi:hypothetical protein